MERISTKTHLLPTVEVGALGIVKDFVMVVDAAISDIETLKMLNSS